MSSEIGSRKINLIDRINQKLEFFVRNSWITLLIIISVAFLLRISFLPSYPLQYDNLKFFLYVNELITTNTLPYSNLDLGWPFFIYGIFFMVPFNGVSDYMLLQRLISIVLSCLTVIPVYYLGKRFFKMPLPFVGALLFVVEPHIIQNSLMGITEPLFIFLGTISLELALRKNLKAFYSAFFVLALYTITRSQGIILFFIISISFLIYFRKDRKIIWHYSVLLVIFLIIIISIGTYRDTITGIDLLQNPNHGHGRFVSSIITETYSTSENRIDLIVSGTDTFVKQLIKSMIPYFGIFAPFGLFLLAKKRNFENNTILVTLIIGGLSSIYILAIVKDLRYIFWLYPIFSILSIFTIQYFVKKIRNKNIFLVLLSIGIISLSSIFLVITNENQMYEEAFEISKWIEKNTLVVNHYTHTTAFLTPLSLTEEDFPNESLTVDYSSGKVLRLKYLSLDEFFINGKENGLTHLVLDGRNVRLESLNDIFNNPDDFSYLEKIYDSSEHGFENYHVKVFEINYEKFRP